MKCQHAGCSKDSVWVQLTIFGEAHYCADCYAAMGGTFKDVPMTEVEETEQRPST